MMATAVAKSSRARTDAVLSGAVDLARAAAEEVADRAEHVGAHEGATIVSERLVEHRFACTMPGYRGWSWTVTLARVPRGRSATVCEVELLPGVDAILAPEWLPWSERLRPGDIGPGDVLPFRADDPRLEPGFVPTGDDEVDEVAIGELALARARVLSHDGIEEAAQRWYDGAAGPRSPHAVAASADCQTCGFLVPLQGELGQIFGVCTNPWSQDDGRVVAFDHGCGAHSETDVPAHAADWPEPAPIIDEMSLEVVDVAPRTTVAAATEPQPDGVRADETLVDAVAQDEATPAEVDAAAAEDVPAGE